MSTVIDALVVTLGLDPKGFGVGSKKAKQDMRELSAEAKKQAADIERSGAQAAAFFSKLRNEALALAAVFTAGVGIKSFVENTIGSAVSLGFMAKNLDMSTESLGAWQHAAQRAGGTADGITAQLKESALELAQVKMGRGSEAATEFYRQGGIDVRNFKTGNEFLLARSKIIHDLFSVDPTRAMLVAQRMGISEDSFNLLKQGPAVVMALVDAQRKNSQITEEQAAAALKLNNAWLDFKDRINTVATQILLRLEPSINRILVKLQSLADWVAMHQGDIGRWLDKTLIALTAFARAADGAAQSVGGWKVVLAGLLALKLVSMVSGLVALAGALGGVGASLGVISALGPAALATLAAVGVYAAADAAEPTSDDGPLAKSDKVGKKDAKDGMSAREAWLRTLASTGDARAAKELYQTIGRNDYPAIWTPEGGKTANLPEKYRSGEGGISEIIDRTLASFGNMNAGIRIKNATGVDDYGVGNAKLDDKPKARNAIAGGRALMDLPAEKSTLKDSGSNPWQISPGVQLERDQERLRILQDELTKATGVADRAALQREIARTVLSTRGYASAINPGGGNAVKGNTSTTDVHIGELNVHTKATDASGIAVGIRSAIQDTLMPSQSNTGLE